MRKNILFIPLLFFILIGFGYLATFKRLDPDFGWHIKTGELILERGVPKIDWYSFTMPDFPWIDHEWLTDVFIYKFHSFFGFQVLLLFFLSLTIFAFLISIRLNRFNYFLFPILGGYFAALSFFGLRPQIITILFIALLLRLLNSFLENSNSWLIYFSPILFLFWVNLHGGFFAGLFILSLILILEIFKKTNLFKKIISYRYFLGQKFKEHSFKEILTLFIILIASFLATIINPYGVRIYEEVFRTIGDPYLSFHIVEWLPLFLSGEIPVFIILYFGFFFGLLIFQYKKIEFNNLVLTFLFFIFSLLHQRYFPIFVIVTIPIFAQVIFLTKKEIIPRRFNILFGGFKKWIAIFVFLAIFGFGFYPILNDAFKSDLSFYYPQKALPFLKTLPPSENLLNEYGWGGYLIWQLPERKLFIDGRMPSWRKDDQFVFGDYLKIMGAKEDFQGLLERYSIKIILLRKDEKTEAQRFENWNSKPKNKLAKFFERHSWIAMFLNLQFPEENIYNKLINLGWQTIYEDEVAIILKK